MTGLWSSGSYVSLLAVSRITRERNMSDPKALLPDDAITQNISGKFKPKLVFLDRCAILALVSHGVKRDRTALAFGVDRRTVSHICNDSSKHYRDVRKHLLELGKEAFIAKYLTEDAALKVARLSPTEVTHPTPDAANKRANRMRGMHVIPVADGLRAKPHTVEIAYKDGEMFAGWYYRDQDGDEPDSWFHHGDDSRKTSQACLAAVIENLLD